MNILKVKNKYLSETDTDYSSDDTKSKDFKDFKTHNILEMKCDCKIKNSFCENGICQLPEINQILFTVLNKLKCIEKQNHKK